MTRGLYVDDAADAAPNKSERTGRSSPAGRARLCPGPARPSTARSAAPGRLRLASCSWRCRRLCRLSDRMESGPWSQAGARGSAQRARPSSLRPGLRYLERARRKRSRRRPPRFARQDPSPTPSPWMLRIPLGSRVRSRHVIRSRSVRPRSRKPSPPNRVWKEETRRAGGAIRRTFLCLTATRAASFPTRCGSGGHCPKVGEPTIERKKPWRVSGDLRSHRL